MSEEKNNSPSDSEGISIDELLANESANATELGMEESDDVEIKPPKSYTDDEFADLEVEQVEPERLTPLQSQWYKKLQNLERGYKGKYEELARIKQQMLSSATSREKPAGEQDIYDMFNRDPAGTIQNINRLIRTKRSQNPDDPDIGQWEDVKDQLLLASQFAGRQEASTRTTIQEFHNQVRRVVPDFDENLSEVSAFAESKLGYSQEELAKLTDVLTLGNVAVKNVKVIFDLWKKQKEVPSKVGRRIPSTIRPGGKPATEIDNEPMSASDFWNDQMALKERIKKSLIWEK